jgi:hypothetical protein
MLRFKIIVNGKYLILRFLIKIKDRVKRESCGSCITLSYIFKIDC